MDLVRVEQSAVPLAGNPELLDPEIFNIRFQPIEIAAEVHILFQSLKGENERESLAMS